MSNSNQTGQIFLGIAIAIGMILGGYFIGQTMYNAKVALNTAEVRGLAERKVKADFARWSVTHSVSGKTKLDIPNLYKQSEANQKEIIALLKASKFTDKEIKVGVTNYNNQVYRDDNQRVVDESHTISGQISIHTTRVGLIANARNKMGKLITKGISLRNNRPTYKFTSLNEIKPEMLRDATKNARIAATEFAKNAGVSVAGIRSARQGNFSILDSGEEYGDSNKIDKDVRVVTRIEFYLK